MKFVATKKCMTTRDPGSGMGKYQDQGSGINIPDPQHRFFLCVFDLNQNSIPSPLPPPPKPGVFLRPMELQQKILEIK